MKKYQRLIKDNIDLISEVEESLMNDIDSEDADISESVKDSYHRAIFVASGAIRMIYADYDYEKISLTMTENIANILFAYASCAYDSKMSHEHKMHCFDLSREIKDNVHYHRMRTPIFQNA